mgnify:CR=1 FL=1
MFLKQNAVTFDPTGVSLINLLLLEMFMLFVKLLVTVFLTCCVLYFVLLGIYTIYDLHRYNGFEYVVLFCAFLSVISGVILLGFMFGHILFLIWTT